MAQLSQHLHLQTLIHATTAPETPLPTAAPSTFKPNRTFPLLLAFLAALAATPFLIAWAAAGLLQ